MDPQRSRLVKRRWRYVVEYHVEERAKVGARHRRVESGGASPGIRIEDRELDLIFGGVQVQE